MTSYISGDQLTKLKHNVHLAARDNRAFHLYTLLCNYDHYSVVKEVVSHQTEEDGQWTTPLLIAARNDHDNAVHVLISNFQADVNDTGSIKIEGQTIQEVTPLWCAAAIGNFGMVKYLIGHRAQVNKTTETSSTPLRAACYSGFMDIIKYLIDNDADISITNKWNNSCLMAASYKGHIDAVTILLKIGALVNQKDYQGSTALHMALEQDHVEIAKCLLNAGSANCFNNINMTPLKIAAYNYHADIVDLLITTKDCSKIDKIDAYELLGASLANDTDPESSTKAYSYLRKGMIERFTDPSSIVHKCLPDPQTTFRNHVECKTIEELDAIKDDNELLDVEGLVVRERILGEHSDVINHLIYRGNKFANDTNYTKCLVLWLHALTVRQLRKESASTNLSKFVNVFVKMVAKVAIKNNFKEVQTVLKCAIDELEFDKNRIEKNEEDSRENNIYQYEQNIHTCLYLLVILVKIPKSQIETKSMHALACKFVQLNLHLCNKDTPLHLATNEDTKIDDCWQSGIIVFPNDKVAKLLIDCGADINAKNSDEHTPQLDNDL